MKSGLLRKTRSFNRFVITLLTAGLFAAPLSAQQPASPAPTVSQSQATLPLTDPSFANLLAADRYKLYGEVRNVGQLLGNGGAGEIVDPIIKLADPGKEFKSIVNFLKKNSEALASSRLLFATWPARTDVPNVLVAIEFATNEDAAKFAPKLEKFLPTVLPPVPVEPEQKPSASPQPRSDEAAKQATPEPKKETAAGANPNSPPPQERLPFVIGHAGNLVFISDKPFKLEKLHPASSKALFQDQNFRITHDKFSTEPVFLFFNVALEEQTKPQTPPAQAKAEAEAAAERKRQEEEAQAQAEAEAARAAAGATPAQSERSTSGQTTTGRVAILSAGPTASPAPTPTKEQQAQKIASNQMGQMFGLLDMGEPQWPEAVGVALALDGDEYVIRAMLIDKPDTRVQPIPFLPQLFAGPAYSADAASVLPDDTEVFVSASIDLAQSYEGMRKQAEIKAKAPQSTRVYRNGVLQTEPAARSEPPLDAFAEFEKKAGFKIKDELLPALGNEIALAGSLKTLQMTGGFGFQPPPSAKPSPEAQNQKDAEVLPIVLIGVRDRDAMRRLMPHVLDGLGMGEANLIAQTERHGDAELVNYAGIFAYGFVGDFLVLSDAATVRRVIDANVNHQTLSSNTVYRNSRRWQSSRMLGQVYVSPALMEGYHEEIRKQVGTMDPEMRDFLLGLNPTAEAITYALSNDGLGTQHELHLPKNLILTMVAGISSATRNPPPEANEMIAVSALQFIVNTEASYKENAGKGSYGSMQQLVDAKLFPKEAFDKYGYNFEINVIGDGFEAMATPREYGKTGKKSFFVDKSGVVRGDDHGGAPATIADKPVQ